MRIIIADHEDNSIQVEFVPQIGEKSITFPEVHARMLGALESIISTAARDASEEERSHLFDILDTSFTNLLYKVFPEIDPQEFDLSAAAVVYAQDQIIQQAEKEGKTYQEMLKEYEAIAEKYIEAKRCNRE